MIDIIKEKLTSFFSSLDKKSFRGNIKNRIDLYKYLINGLRSNLSLNIKTVIEARIRKHERVHNKKNLLVRILIKPGGSEMKFLVSSLEKINEGQNNLSIFMGGWVTPNEEMLIKSNESGQLADSLDLAIELLEETTRIKKSVTSQLVYPIILFIALIGIMYGFAWYFVPILLEISDVEDWSGSQVLLYDLSIFLQENTLVVPVGSLVLSTSIISTFPIWTGKIREKFDAFIPWSMYREFNAAMFLISLSTMMKNGTTFINALIGMRTAASPYIKRQIDKMLEVAKKADKDNSAALNTHLLGDVGDDIEDLSRYGDFEKVLNEEGEKSINIIIERISKQAGIFKQVALVFVMGYVMWAFSTFMSIVQGVANSV